MLSCNCEHSDWLRTLPETLVSSANLRMEFLMLLFTKRFGNVSATCNVSVSVSSRSRPKRSRAHPCIDVNGMMTVNNLLLSH